MIYVPKFVAVVVVIGPMVWCDGGDEGSRHLVAADGSSRLRKVRLQPPYLGHHGDNRRRRG